MSAKLRRRAREVGGGRRLGLRFDLAQRLRSPIGDFWVVAGGKGIVCLFIGDVTSGVCGHIAAAIEDGMVLEVYKQVPPHGRLYDFRAVGIAPDRAAEVSVRVSGRELSLPVVENAFGHRADHPIRISDLVR
jgi:hypothetical protein